MCSIGCAKILLFTCNILFFMGGAVLLSFGIAGVANPIGLGVFLSSVPGVQSMAIVVNIPDLILSACVFMIVLGSIMLVFGFLGCAGACFMMKPLLFLYWLLLGGLILAEIALIIYAAVDPRLASSQVQKVMYDSLVKNYQAVSLNTANRTVTLPSNIISLAWVSMQFEVGCCGAYGPYDYQNFTTWNNTFYVNGGVIQAKVPPSCCTLNTPKTVPRSSTDFQNLESCLNMITPYYNEEGCYKQVVALAAKFMWIPIGICCAVLIIEILCMIGAIYLWRVKPNAEKMT